MVFPCSGPAGAGVPVCQLNRPSANAALPVDGIPCPFGRFFQLDIAGYGEKDADADRSSGMDNSIPGKGTGCQNGEDEDKASGVFMLIAITVAEGDRDAGRRYSPVVSYACSGKKVR